MWRIVGLAGCLACGPVLAAEQAPAECVPSHVESCVATMKNVFGTPEQTREYCTRAAHKACEPAAPDPQ